MKQGGAFEFTIKTNFKKEVDLDKLQDKLRQDTEDAKERASGSNDNAGISKLQDVDIEIITLKK